MKVAILTTNQKDQLQGQQYTTDSYFNPIQDLNNNWIISQEEMNSCTNEEFQWVKTLPLIDYIPKPTVDPMGI
jgi:hypothetical protein